MASEADDDDPQDRETDGAAESRAEGAIALGDRSGEQDTRDDVDEDDEDDEDDEEPRLKYARLTSSLGGLYRNGDATSAFVVSGDIMVIGTHNGNIHVLALPSLQSIRVYHAHSASVTALSIAPVPTARSNLRSAPVGKPGPKAQDSPGATSSEASTSSAANTFPQQHQKKGAPTSTNAVHIASSSLDGNVCVAALADAKDVHLRNFSRPVQAVALSPDFQNDRSYLSGGLAGRLLFTVGGRPGTSSTSNAGAGAAASASGWLGVIGLGSNTGKDTVLHSGEGAISTIKWSKSGKYVLWINEQGIKIMRSNLHLESADTEFAWKRISHVDHPNRPGWDEMSAVWKGRAEWIDDESLSSERLPYTVSGNSANDGTTSSAKERHGSKSGGMERVIVGWGGTVWVICVHPGGPGKGKEVGERTAGRAEITKLLHTDCVISGVTLLTPSVLMLLAYVTSDEGGNGHALSPTRKKTIHMENAKSPAVDQSPKRGIQHRHDALPPELRLIDLDTSEEISVDNLSVNRFETLSATDYHLGVLPSERNPAPTTTSRGALEAFGGSLWNASVNATKIFSSAAILRNGDQKPDSTQSAGSTGVSAAADKGPTMQTPTRAAAQSAAASAGLKIYIHSPYDCVLAVKRDLADHLEWLKEKEKFEEAWTLLSNHPEIVGSPSYQRTSTSSPATPVKRRPSIDEFFADDVSKSSDSEKQTFYSIVEKEKRAIGERWLRQLLDAHRWEEAGMVAGKVLGESSRWESWAWEFIQARKIREITPYIPTVQLRPPLPSLIYEVILGYYISNDRVKLGELLDYWPSDLFDIHSVIGALEAKLKSGEIREHIMQDRDRDGDWQILTSALAKLYLADGRPRDALRSYIKLQDADSALALIKEYHLLHAVSDDIPGLILLRISEDQLRRAPAAELEHASTEVIDMLVDEAYRGSVRPQIVVEQLQERDGFLLFLFFYLRALWRGSKVDESRTHFDSRTSQEGQSLVEEFGDLAVELFAEYDRPLLMDMLKTSESYTFAKASEVCEKRSYIPELVYLLSKTGQTRDALFLIIDRLGSVPEAIAFAKSQDDPDLWNDLLDYSMDKPRFIRGLLEEVGTAIDPITLVRRIPEGLEIEGLREGLSRMIKEYEIQASISEGVARVLRGEVALGMDTLRSGQRKGIKFEVLGSHDREPRSQKPNGSIKGDKRRPQIRPGACDVCRQAFARNERDSLVGFACGHVFHLHCIGQDDDGLDDHGDQVATAIDPSSPDFHSSTSRSVSSKVTHARLIREKVAGGCPACVHKRETGIS